jgi:RNA-directed DNA polymerase
VHAWERVSGNAGARTPGVDWATVAQIVSRIGVEVFLGHVRDSLKSGEFEPVEVRRVLIPKASGKLRKLGIPTVADRVVQASLKAVLEPISRRTSNRARTDSDPGAAPRMRLLRSTFWPATFTSGC